MEADSRACDLNAANEDLKSKIVMMTEELAAAKEHYEKVLFATLLSYVALTKSLVSLCIRKEAITLEGFDGKLDQASRATKSRI